MEGYDPPRLRRMGKLITDKVTPKEQKHLANNSADRIAFLQKQMTRPNMDLLLMNIEHLKNPNERGDFTQDVIDSLTIIHSELAEIKAILLYHKL